MNSKVFDLYSFTREELSNYIEMGNFQSAIIPTGSTEQHLDHLAVNMDIEMSRYIATKSAEELYPNTLITSPISIGIAEHHMHFAGTISAKPGSWLSIIFDLVESILRHGIRKILILNGHGGNVAPVQGVLEQWQLNLIATQDPSVKSKLSSDIVDHYQYVDEVLNNKKNDVDIRFNSYWDYIPENLVNSILETKEYPGHAAEFETSLAMYAIPYVVRFNKVHSSNEIGIQKASFEKGRQLAAEAISGTIATVKDMLDLK
jgi:creatinine amidohydrolase